MNQDKLRKKDRKDIQRKKENHNQEAINNYTPLISISLLPFLTSLSPSLSLSLPLFIMLKHLLKYYYCKVRRYNVSNEGIGKTEERTYGFEFEWLFVPKENRGFSSVPSTLWCEKIMKSLWCDACTYRQIPSESQALFLSYFWEWQGMSNTIFSDEFNKLSGFKI